MSTTLEDVKYIDQNAKDLVNGYLKRINVDKTFHDDIPSLVYYWCLLYYHIKECFDAENCHRDYELDKDNTIVKKRQDSNFGVVYLSKVVSKGIHRWKFQLHIGNNYGTSITIGVWKNNRQLGK